MSHPTILVVEDEASFVEALQIGLGREGFHVEVATDGVEAMDRFASVDPDLVILDVMLPRASGIDVCRQMRATSGVPIIMVTARVEEDDRGVFAVGKIADIFAHRGVTDIRKAHGNDALIDTTLQAMDDAADGDFVFTNFIDFDQIYGHRRDVAGYAACLEHFDSRLPELAAKLREGDMMVLTADHGNDPTWTGSDHTRERVPVLIAGPGLPTGDLGKRETFADIGATIASHLGLEIGPYGRSMI